MRLKSPWLLGIILLVPVLGCSPEKYTGITLEEPVATSLPNPGILYNGKINFAYGQGGSGGFMFYSDISGTTVNFSDPSETYLGMDSLSVTIPVGSQTWEEPIFLNTPTDYSSGHYTTGTLYVMATGAIGTAQFATTILSPVNGLPGEPISPAVTLTSQWQKVTCPLATNLTAVIVPLELLLSFMTTNSTLTIYVADVTVQ